MKSLRRVKLEKQESTAAGAKAVGSTHSLKSLHDVRASATDMGNNEDWLATRQIIKPPDQLELTDKELDEELTRILNANSPHAAKNIARYNLKERTYKCSPSVDHHVTHFEFEGYLVYKGAEDEEAEGAALQRAAEAKVAEAATGGDAAAAAGSDTNLAASGDGAAAGGEPKSSKNNFNSAARATQTVNNPSRDRTTNTEPPPKKLFSANVNQWAIYDAYMDDLAAKEKAAKEKTKTTGKGQKEDERETTTLPPTAAETHSEEIYYRNPELRKAIVMIERMANENTFDDILEDYKYWEDMADQFRDGKGGSLLPLWKFVTEKDKKKQVTAISWNPKHRDMFAVGYGSYDFSKPCPGLIACFTLKNPSNPEYLYTTKSGVMCLDYHPQHPHMIAAGLYDGTVLVYNLQKKLDTPLYQSPAKHGKHTDPVWQVSWQKDDLDDNMNFYSISSDGRITQWTLLKNELLHTDIIKLAHGPESPLATANVAAANNAEAAATIEPHITDLENGTCFDFNKAQESLFVLGTESGKILKCSKDYNNQTLMIYEGHHMPVYAVRYSPIFKSAFLSAGADWTVKLWDHNLDKPVMTFDLNASVGDVAWSPYSATVFAAVTAQGKVFVFDLSINKYEPICEQQVIRKAKLTHVSFNPYEPILIVGDDRGQVVSLKLSPNLRKCLPEKDEEAQKLEKIMLLALGKSLDR